ncbi:MAG: hypothetical protein ACI4Q3_06050 [Kiritimatiellia bacterium]
MKIVGDPIFAKNPDGTLKSRIGTLFFRTPGLVTQKGVHAMQRLAWTRELNRERAAAGRPELTESEAMAEWADSADLIFTDDYVLIRPDPERMDLAFKADDVLQTLVSKRQIRFLNTHAAKVRSALQARGENWRMSRPAQSTEEIVRAIESARVAISHEPIYYYNGKTGTRFLTVAGFSSIARLDADAFRVQLQEIAKGLRAVNRLGQPEIALFPASVPADLAEALKAVDAKGMDDAALRAAYSAVETKWRLALPKNLRDESTANLDWRNEMSAELNRRPNETAVGDDDLIQGISPEFFRQIEWLPGAHVEDGQLIFDSLYDEAQRTQDPELLAFCDARVRSIIFDLMRTVGTLEYVNVGRILHSLARRPVAGARRGTVYLLQYKDRDRPTSQISMIRFQKWGVAEHLDEGRDLLQSMLAANEYADYIMDRRLACRQLGMNLPQLVTSGQIVEKYLGRNQYCGTAVRAHYFIRSYVPGTASDKVPVERFRNPAFAHRFAALMGQAAALDLIVGRAATETGEPTFDQMFEVVRLGPDGLPAEIRVTDHAGSFVKYRESLDELVGAYANPVLRREKYVGDFVAFAKAYVRGFEQRLSEVQANYRARRVAFDELFLHRPYDQAGSGAYRWSCVLKRLDACDPQALAEALKRAIQSRTRA